MERSLLVIILALGTLVLVGVWAYMSKRKAKSGLGLDKKRD